MGGFVNKLYGSREHDLKQFKATDVNGNKACYFVLIEPHRKKAFDRALSSGKGAIDFSEYGKIVASCFGDAPNQDTKQLLKDKYGFSV